MHKQEIPAGFELLFVFDDVLFADANRAQSAQDATDGSSADRTFNTTQQCRRRNSLSGDALVGQCPHGVLGICNLVKDRRHNWIYTFESFFFMASCNPAERLAGARLETLAIARGGR